MKRLLIAAGVLVLGIGVLLAVSFVRRGNDRRALAAYKAQLRAQGEWLTIEDAGYPFELDPNSDLKTFTNLANQLNQPASLLVVLDHMPFASSGLMIVTWREPAPVVWSNGQPGPARTTWEELASGCDAGTPTLVALRAELEHPPRRFNWDYTNLFGSAGPKLPFVQVRRTAQVFAIDTLVALRADDLQRARADLHALTQLTHLCGDDLTLVTSMIRVAVAGLGLDVTAQALSHEGWDEAGLAALQRDWEAVDLINAVETGLVGERLFGLQMFSQLRQRGTTNTPAGVLVGPSGTGGLRGLRDRMLERVALICWRGHMDGDELFYLQHYQGKLDLLRELETQGNWVEFEERTRAQREAYDEMIASLLGRYRFQFSAIAIANVSRAVETTMRNETQRRLTVTAIALKRFHLRHGQFPRNLQTLVPDCVATVPLDPWSGEPLVYRLNYDGTITLYSVGEDGVDDGGDSTPASASGRVDFWSGKDVVWPRAYSPTNQVGQ